MAHRMESVIGFSTGAEEDSKGLVVRGELTLESTGGRDAYALMKHASSVHQNLGLSIGYRIRPDGYEISDRTGVRILKDLDVMEFSVAVCPANPRARVLGVKSAAWTERDFEEYLRDAGLSREAAKRFVLRGYSGLADQRDADAGDHKGADTAFIAELRELKDYISLIGV
jgi:HK97 family phage prohead protease